jgi:NIPSNAP
MKSLLTSLLLISCLSLSAQLPDTRYFELRIYYCYPGRLDALIARFQNHTTRIFEKHGMENIGYWLPTKNDKNALYYILAYPSKEAREKSWTDFRNDPEWKEVAAKSETSGKIVESVTSVFMNVSDIFPNIKAASPGQEHVYELRTYTCLPGRLPNLLTRFRDHTLKLFEKHQMENIAYFLSEEKENQPKLVYLLAHKSEEEAAKSWTAFINDPAWKAASEASEKDGKILEKLESVFLKPLSFSKMK